MIRDAAVVILIVAGLFLAFEGTTRLFWPQKIETTYVDDRSLGIEDEVLGHRLRPSARAIVEGPEFSAVYDINARGLRDAVTRSGPKPPGVTRILVLGDSFAFATGNAYDEAWPVVFEGTLEAAGRPVDVVKAGVPGYDTRTEALYLERIFADYEPDIVLVTFLPNDLFTNRPIDHRPAGHAAADTEHDEPVVRPRNDKKSTLHSLVLVKRLLMANDYLYTRLYLMTPRRAYFARPYDDHIRRQIEITKDLLRRMQAYCRERGAELVVLSIPQQFQVLAASLAEPPDDVDIDGIDTVFAAFAERQGFTWLPAMPHLVERYGGTGEDLYYRYDGHLNAAGNAEIGRFLAERFEGRLIDRLDLAFGARGTK